MRGVINQPCLFPEVHVIHRLWWCGGGLGVFVLMNKAQFQRKYGMAAARFPNGVTVGLPLREVTGRVACKDRFLADDLSTWRADIMKIVEKNYPHMNREKLGVLFNIVREGRNYADVCFDTTNLINVLLQAECDVITDEDCVPPEEHDPCGWILGMCNRLHITDYFCGAKISKAYLDMARCEQAGVNIVFQDWLPPTDGNVTWLHYWFADKIEELKGSFK